MPATIEPEPEGTDAAKDLDTPVGLAVVDAVLAGLSRGVERKELARSVGVTAHIVKIIDANREWWAKYPPKASRQRESRPTLGCKVRSHTAIAPEGAKIVPAYRCGDHLSVFLPCHICKMRILRNRAKKP